MPITHVGTDRPRQLQEIADTLAAAKRIVMVTGAGISTNCGIPDFRSKEGLYSLINAEYNSHLSTSSSIGAVKGKDLFDASLWKDELSTSVFYTFIASLRQKIRDEVKETTTTHKFIRSMRDRRKLVRCYTQNIDGLEARDGLCMDLSTGKGSRTRFSKKSLAAPSSAAATLPGSTLSAGCEVVPLHGDLSVLRCTLCRHTTPWGAHSQTFLAGSAPFCPECVDQDAIRRCTGKRGSAIGTLRPNVVLYGEEHPCADAIATISTNDLQMAPDLLLILGTSLKVHGLKALVREFARSVHAHKGGRGKVVFVNLTEPAESVWKDTIDYWVEMDCDAWVRAMKRLRPELGTKQTGLAARKIKNPVSRVKASKKADLNGPAPVFEDDKENAAPSLSSTTVMISPTPAELRTMLATKITDAPSTPRKPALLLTPPSTHSGTWRSRAVPLFTGAKRVVADAELLLPMTPLSRKRDRAVQIWQDLEVPDSEEWPSWEEEDELLMAKRRRVGSAGQSEGTPSRRKNVRARC